MKKILPALSFLLGLGLFPHFLFADHLSTHLMFTARLTGDQEVPVVTTDAQGVAIFSLDRIQSTLYLNVSVNELSGPIMGAHIHEAIPGENGPVVIDLTPFLNGNRLKGALRNMSKETLTKLLDGIYYINIHTEANPGGEIRGQIRLETDYRYTAYLNGNQEVPEVVTDAQALGIFHLNASKTKVDFSILFLGLSSPLSGAHIHNAPAGMNGGVIFDLGPFIQGNRIEGSWEPGPMLEALEAGELYVNIHTDMNPGGEIRGQILLQPGLTFDAKLDGDQENPAVVTPGNGLAVITLNSTLDQMAYDVLFDSLTGPAMAAHFHRGNAGINGGVVINISSDISTNSISGTTAVDQDILHTLLNGGFYINIHTEAHPSGEIRGQVYRFAREGYSFDINGGQEVPAVTTTGTGAGMVSIDRDQSNAHFMIVISGLEGSFAASHFHQAAPGINGGVIFDLTDFYNDFGGAYGYWDENSPSPFDVSPLFRNNLVYVNVHTDLHPGGEIRGNISRSRDIFTDLPFDPGFGDNLILTGILTGDDEVPPVATNAFGLATMYFDGDKTRAQINVTATGLSGPITGVHIHEADIGTNGPVLFPLTNVGNRIQQEITDITELHQISLMNNATYVNIHTEANPGGEIRGQLFLDQDYTFVTSLNGNNEEPPVATTGRGLASIHYTLGTLTLDVNVQLTSLSSAITGAHFHSGMPGENGPVIIDLTDLIDGNIIRGTVDITILDLIELVSGNVYLNVHTENNPGGEIRGQLNYLPGIVFDGWMSGNQEVPFTTSSASGLAVATVYPSLRDVAVWMLADNVSGPIGAAHLHNAPLQTNGGVVHDLSDELVDNGLIHLGVLANGVLASLLEGSIYINAHTAAYPGGELRGQLFRLSRDGYGFDLCPEQEVGAVDAPDAVGSAFLSIDRLHTNVNMGVVVDGLTGPIISSHIHQAGIGENGGVITNLTDFYVGNGMSVYGATADTALINVIRTGNTYVNVHTDQYPAGEVRGQIVKEFLCELMVGLDPLGDLIQEVKLSPVPALDELYVTIEVVKPGEYELGIVDIMGRKIFTQLYDMEEGLQMFSLPVYSLSPGMYSLIISDGVRMQGIKFIK